MRLAKKSEVKRWLSRKKGVYPSEDQWAPVYDADDQKDYIQVGLGDQDKPESNGQSYRENCEGETELYEQKNKN